MNESEETMKKEQEEYLNSLTVLELKRFNMLKRKNNDLKDELVEIVEQTSIILDKEK